MVGDIILPKTFHSKSIPAPLTVAIITASQDVNIMFYIPRYESENSFEEDIALNNVADPLKYIEIMTE